MLIKKNFERVLKMVMAIMFLSCLLDWDYFYFQLVRSIGMIGFFILGIKQRRDGNELLSYIWLFSAVLINPLIKVSLGRELWNVVDVIWALLLMYTLKENNS